MNAAKMSLSAAPMIRASFDHENEATNLYLD
jgi:hypothetical protein